MLFSSISYLIFFPLVLAAYWLSPQRFRPVLLLIASYIFYMSWFKQYGLLLLILTCINYALGLIIGRSAQKSKLVFIFGLVINLGVLSFYKYANFILESISAAMRISLTWLPIHTDYINMPVVNVILPLGISFFVFEFIHYLTDIYKGGKPIGNPIEFGLFAAFFPSQIAGPIKRYQDFVHQLECPVTFSATQFHEGIGLLLQGLFKKVALADNLAPLVVSGFQSSQQLGTLDAWVASLAFALQIYFDFSGYTDMGRGSAMLLGFSLPDNFNLPYIASSLTDFWKRWHISLSTWLRDYLYIPLGGGRTSRWRKSFNLMVTMLLGGLWHGAAWHYVFWGGFHGLGLVANHGYDAISKNHQALQRFHASIPGKFISTVITLIFVLIGWVFFRADNATQALQVVHSMFIFQGQASSEPLFMVFLHSPLPAIIFAYSLYLLIKTFSQKLLPVQPSRHLPLGLPTRIAVYLGAFIASIGFAPSHGNPFIYFQF